MSATENTYRINRLEVVRGRHSSPTHTARMGEMVHEIRWEVVRESDGRCMTVKFTKSQAKRYIARLIARSTR
jgi:hypothetical protein